MADDVACIQEVPVPLGFDNATPASLDAERTLSPPGTRPSRRRVLKRMFQRSSTLRVLSLNMGGDHRNPLEFELRGDSSEKAAHAMAVLRRSGKALRDMRYGPRSMREPERELVTEILAAVFFKAESEQHQHIQEMLQCQTWALVLSHVIARQPHLFDALNSCTLKLRRPSVFENPVSCRTFTTTVDYLTAWLQWYRGLDRASDFWLEEAPRCAREHGMELSTGFAGLLLFDLMCLCAAQCAMGDPEPGTATHSAKPLSDTARDIPFREIRDFTSQLPAFNSKARHECAWTLIQRMGAHVLFAQRAGRLFEHGLFAEAFLPPFYALDGRTGVFLKRGAFTNATDISAALRAKMEDRINLEAPEHSRAAWQTASSSLAAVYCQYQLKAESVQACLASLHCPYADITASFLEALRVVLAAYAADVNIVGVGSCCTGKESAILQRRLRSAGFEIGRQVDQVTVAKQRTHFQTQVQKAGEADIAHTDFVLSWGSARLRRGETLYTPDVRTPYGVDQESKLCIRFPTIRWPFDHCSVATSFELRKGCTRARLFQWRAIRVVTSLAMVLFILLLPFFSVERESPYGPPGTWFHDNWPGTPRVGICEVPLPCQEGGWSHHGEACYKATPKLDYGDAERFCHERDSLLVSIGSEAENDFVTDVMCPAGEFCWIGLRSDIERERYSWASGEPVDYNRLVGAQGRLFPLFPLSRDTKLEVAVLSTIPSHTSGCRVMEFLAASADLPQDLLWVRMFAIGFAFAVSAVLLTLPRPQLFQTSAFLWTTCILNAAWYLSSVLGYCAAEDIESLGFAFSFSSLLDAGATAITAMWAYWIILRRICVLYSAKVPLTVFSLLSVTMFLWAVSFLLFVDAATTLSPSLPVLLSFSLTGLLIILYLVFAASIASKLYQTWTSLKREATTGCSKEGGSELSSQERAAQIHFFSVLAAIITGAFRWTALLAWLLEATQHRFVLWTRFATSLAISSDVIANNLCAYLLAVLDMDDSVVHASGITAEVMKRASLEVEQHQLAVQLLKAAPTSKSQLRHLAQLERLARSSSVGDLDQEPVFMFHAAVQAETSRIHWLMRCVRLRAMTMPLRYQYLMDIPTIQSEPRQHVPPEFAGGESEEDESEYFSWLYDYADAVQPVFFQQVMQLVKTFNNTQWPSCLGLVPEQFPWMIWANGGSSGISTHLLHSAAVISPGDILFHSPARTGLGRLARRPYAHCIVLEESASHVSIHRSGSASPQEVAREELRSCNGGAVFVPGPMKKRQRCLEKIDADYYGKEPWPAAASLVDICRCMIVIDDPYAIAVLVAHIRNTMRVVRLKNRFSEDVLEVICPEDLQAMFYEAATQLEDGSRSVANDHVEDRQYRDISINVEITGPQGCPCICEIQVTLSNLAILKHADTSLYTIRRMQSLKELQTSHVFLEAARRSGDRAERDWTL